ncbi:MAG: leucine-rich repeat domain-containing protein [Gammaproteobacteria bacterium]|nr:leucine-rich repeat domain-containing protein [Gammaproteobacteria bacterium]
MNNRLGRRQVLFSYGIRHGDSGDLAIARDALTLAPGAGLFDGSGNAAELDLGEHAVSAGTSYRAEAIEADASPVIEFVFPAFSNDPYMGSWGEGERLRVFVSFDEPVTVDTTGGSPELRLQLGTQTRSFQFAGYDDRWTHRSDLAFDYYVQPSDFFLTSGDAQLLLNGATIRDATGNDAMLDVPATNLFWPRVDGEAPPPASPRIESKSFPRSEISSERGPDRSFGANEFIDIPLYFSESVEVIGEPTVPFQIGAEERRARYLGGSGTRRLLFRYRVVASDLGPVELYPAEVELNGGAIRGLDGNNAQLDVRAYGWIASQYYFVNGLRVPDSANAAAVPLANLRDASLRGAVVQALGKIAGTAVTVSEMSDLTTLAAPDSGISDLTGLELAMNLEDLDLSGNAVSDLSPLAELTGLDRLDLSGNAIRDIAPLLANSGLGAGDTVYLHGNPLSAESIETHIPALRDRGVSVYHIDLSIMAASAHEGESLAFTVRLSLPAADDVEVDWEAVAGGSDAAVAGDDFPSGESGTLVIPAGGDSRTLTVFTNADQAEETHETLRVRLTEVSGGLPEGVVLVGREAPGLIVEPGVPAVDAPVFAAADHATRQGFVRVINRGPRGAVHIDAVDDQGNRRSTSLDIAAGGTVHFNSNDLENGNVGKGLTRGVGTGTGNWRLELSGIDVQVLAYMRTGDGFLTSLHDLVPAEEDGYRVPIFNPGSNMDQVSSLRVFNANEQDAALTVSATDDRGMASAGDVQLQLAAGEARTISAADLESGAGLSGALGDGAGKWELLVDSDQPVGLASLLESPTGHLTNLSTWADNSEEGPDGTTHHVLLFPSASDANDRQGFLRIVNRGPAGTVSIKAYDDSTWDYDPVTMELQAGQTIHFNSNDLEFGNDAKGLPVGVGMGSGDWRLELTSELDLDVLAYIRRINDGFLTGMHDTVPLIEDVYAVPTFNPGRNRNQVSLLRLVNPGGNAAEVTIRGVDDAGVDASGAVRLTVPARSVRTVSAQELEARSPHHAGALGRGHGKWRLAIESDQPIQVINLLQSPTGHLTNLSTWPDQER